MKSRILNILFLLYCINSFAQTIEPSIDHYLTGEIHWKGQNYCDSVNGIKTCFSIGPWTYWHQNGQKMLETFDRKTANNTGSTIRYINMWLPSGQQILKDGNGIYYEDEPLGGGDHDSLVYQITDSIKHGSYKCYRLYKGSSYFLAGTGQYNHNTKDGKFKFRDTVRYLIEDEIVYNNNEETSSYKYLYKNLAIKEEGSAVNGQTEGLCKFYNEKGFLIKEVNYKNGSECGEYKEFYPNGKIKISGQYIHTKGFIKVISLDVNGDEHISQEPSDKVAAKDGEWKYFDLNGKLTKTKKYTASVNRIR